jgi:hypothetical protein
MGQVMAHRPATIEETIQAGGDLNTMHKLGQAKAPTLWPKSMAALQLQIRLTEKLPLQQAPYRDPSFVVIEVNKERDALKAEVAELRAKLSRLPEERSPDYHGPLNEDGLPKSDTIHERVHEVVRDVLAGRVLKPARDQLRDALDKTPKPKPDFPLRALAFPNQKIGLILPGWGTL